MARAAHEVCLLCSKHSQKCIERQSDDGNSERKKAMKQYKFVVETCGFNDLGLDRIRLYNRTSFKLRIQDVRQSLLKELLKEVDGSGPEWIFVE